MGHVLDGKIQRSVDFGSQSLVLESTTTKIPSGALTTTFSMVHSPESGGVGVIAGVESSGSRATVNVNPSSSVSDKDTTMLLFLVTLICITIYFSYYFWKKRHRATCHVRKLEDYSYSRLSQNEMDNIQFNNSMNDQDYRAFPTGEEVREEADENQDKDDPTPAIIQLEMDTELERQNHTSYIMDELSDEDLLQ